MYSEIAQLMFFTVLFALVLVAIVLRSIQVKYKGSGHGLDSDRIISAHGRKIAVIVSIIVIYIFLDIGVTYSITTDKETYAVGEIITASINVHNPYPFPIRLWDFSGSITPEGGVIVKEITGYAAQAAADRAKWYSGVSDKGMFLEPYENKSVRVFHYTTTEEGRFSMRGSVKHKITSWKRDVNYIMTEYDPVPVTVNSTGITLFLEASEDPDNPTILIRVGNDNTYPVRIPVFSPLEKKNSSFDSGGKVISFISWGVSHWDIPAYSTKTIHNTDAYASDDRTSIYYTLYGPTLRYPPE